MLVHLDRGFSLVDSGLASPSKIIWSYSFDKLKASADDGNRLLFLDFGGEEGEIVSIIEIYLKYSDVFKIQIFNNASTFTGARYGMLPETSGLRITQLLISQSTFAHVISK